MVTIPADCYIYRPRLKGVHGRNLISMDMDGHVLVLVLVNVRL